MYISHYLQGFIQVRWCRISSIKSITSIEGKIRYLQDCIQTRLLAMCVHCPHWPNMRWTLIQKWKHEKTTTVASIGNTFFQPTYPLPWFRLCSPSKEQNRKTDNIQRINPKQAANRIKWVLKCSIRRSSHVDLGNIIAYGFKKGSKPFLDSKVTSLRHSKLEVIPKTKTWN